MRFATSVRSCTILSQQGGAKIVWLPDATQLTEAAANALLKTLEEPPANCWFFLSVREPSRLLATLRSPLYDVASVAAGRDATACNGCRNSSRSRKRFCARCCV